MNAQGYFGLIYIAALVAMVAFLPNVFSTKQLFVGGLLAMMAGFIGVWAGVTLGERGFAPREITILVWSWSCVLVILLGPALFASAFSAWLRAKRLLR